MHPDIIEALDLPKRPSDPRRFTATLIGLVGQEEKRERRMSLVSAVSTVASMGTTNFAQWIGKFILRSRSLIRNRNFK